MTEQLRLLLGTARLRALVLLLAVTGLASLVLNTFGADAMPWVTSAQTLLALSVPVGALAILVSSLDRPHVCAGSSYCCRLPARCCWV